MTSFRFSVAIPAGAEVIRENPSHSLTLYTGYYYIYPGYVIKIVSYILMHG